MMLLGLTPHGYCFLWNRGLTSLHVLSDGLIAIAYFSLPSIMYLNRDRATPEVRSLVLMFAAFILTCGVGHLLSIWNIWHGDYWIEGAWKVVIAVASLTTAWELKDKIPSLMGFHRQLSETEILANTDRLTGLANRRGLEQAFEKLTQLAATSGKEGHVLILMDLDHFKLINDSYGHLVGDRLLQAIAQVLNRHTRAADIVARLGGDEFAIVLVGCSLPRAQLIAETLRQEIAQLQLEGLTPVNSADCLVTVSIGVHRLCFTAQTSFESIFNQADELLYASKKSGRDRITLGAIEAVQEA